MTTPAVIVALIAFVVIVALYAMDRFPNPEELMHIKGVVWRRYVPNDNNVAVQDADRAIGYTERIVDRQINKARGILPFNSIVIAVFSFERTRLPSELHIWNLNINGLIIFVMALLAVSSIFCLLLMLVNWPTRSALQSFGTEFYN